MISARRGGSYEVFISVNMLFVMPCNDDCVVDLFSADERGCRRRAGNTYSLPRLGDDLRQREVHPDQQVLRWHQSLQGRE